MANKRILSLAKALKLKNRLISRVTRLTKDIQTYNSVQEGSEVIDIAGRFQERNQAVIALTELKYAIYSANLPIQKSIFELAELKTEIALLSALDSKHGQYREVYHAAAPINYIAALRKPEIEAKVKDLEKRIDELQDRLDAFNHTTTIEVDLEMVDVAG